MKTIFILGIILIISVLISVEGKKISWGRGTSSKKSNSPSSSSSSRSSRTSSKSIFSGFNSQPVQKSSSLQGWQLKSSSTNSRKSKPSQTHSYPSSNTGLSGTNVQKAHSYPSSNHQQSPTQTKPDNNHGYPSSHGLSGSNNGASYPKTNNGGLSGASQPSQLSGNSHGAGYPKTNNGALSGPTQISGNSAMQTHGSNGYPGSAPASNLGPKPVQGYNNMNYNGNNYGGNHHQGQPPPYSPSFGGGHHGYNNPSPQMPGYFGNYGNSGQYGGMSRGRSALTGLGIAGAGIGTVLTGLALWNLARSTGRQHHTVVYDNRGQPVAVAPGNNETPQDSMLSDLVNCTLTIDSGNSTEILGIPCAIATSFSPDAHVEDVDTKKDGSDKTKCIITVVTKTGRELTTTIPCSVLLNTAAENNVTEPNITSSDGQIESTTNTSTVSSDSVTSNSMLLTAKPSEIICNPENQNCTIPFDSSSILNESKIEDTTIAAVAA